MARGYRWRPAAEAIPRGTRGFTPVVRGGGPVKLIGHPVAPRLAARKLRDFALNQPAPYLHWGFILISLPNLGLIAFMILLFVVALFLPFPGRARRRRSYQERDRER